MNGSFVFKQSKVLQICRVQSAVLVRGWRSLGKRYRKKVFKQNFDIPFFIFIFFSFYQGKCFPFFFTFLNQVNCPCHVVKPIKGAGHW